MYFTFLSGLALLNNCHIRMLIPGRKLCSSPDRSPRQEVVLQGVDLRLHDQHRQDPQRPRPEDGHVSFDQQYCRGWSFFVVLLV